MRNKEAKAMVGCIFSLIQLLIITPIWFWFLFWVLSLLAAPPGLYILYWVYVALTVLNGLVSVLVTALATD